MDLQKTLEGLSEEAREKARSLKTPEEIISFAKEQGFDLSDTQLEAVAGGLEWLPDCKEQLNT